MATATVTSKGQVTIPIEVRQKLGIRTGTRLEFVEGRNGGIELFAKTGSVTALAGMFRYSGPTVSIEEMDDAIAAAAVERYDRASREAP
jgi:AbrB family looped-hinge helix DNA binding protein